MLKKIFSLSIASILSFASATKIDTMDIDSKSKMVNEKVKYISAKEANKIELSSKIEIMDYPQGVTIYQSRGDETLKRINTYNEVYIDESEAKRYIK